MEVHAQLLTESKMYCGCSARYASAPPNTLVCPVCMGMPGVLPVINQKAVEYTIMTGLALNCTIPESSRFDPKNHPYPDLPKGYQISQYETPLCQNGSMAIEVNGESRRVGITRVHLEEDTAKLTHRTDQLSGSYSLIDMNRAGVPLMEIVGEPDLRSAEEARQYLVKLRTILQYLRVCTGSMEEGAFRCDANISVRPAGSTTLGKKVEVKNMNSFRAVYRAMEYEAQRQIKALEAGEEIHQETRGWLDGQGITLSQRSKEYAHDYRYFPEPDLPPLHLSRDFVDGIRRCLPELPDARRERFMADYGLSAYDAWLLTGSVEIADFFESGTREYPNAKALANWITGELFRLLNTTGQQLSEARVTPERLVEMLRLIDQGAINQNTAKVAFEEMFTSGKQASEIVAERGLSQISDQEALRSVIQQVVDANPQALADYRAGKKQAIGFLTGQVMRATRGKANPGMVNQLLAEYLAERGAGG
ncbi:MAG: Asp-tRNA(Asn)/Glu-tRNA(Gln) amidotransferase subunit GatB [Chloroflexi bacterium]|nr:Asp-tRNA(Asn)/Glu-tRNA(Gln) amidotransferase subunit GatB [Chloroflexota bacterium]